MTTVEPGIGTWWQVASTDVRVSPVQRRLEQILDDERANWRVAGDSGAACLAALTNLLSDGKRIRPTCCLWGYVGAGGDTEGARWSRVVDAAVALELLHGFALVHDDVMDGSATRRGHPSVHAGFEAAHRGRGWRGDSQRYGTAMAVLVGDTAFALAQRLARTLTPQAAAVWERLIRDLTVGQYLDLLGTARGDRDQRFAARVARLKSGSYTIEHPLQLGAALAEGLSPAQFRSITCAYAVYGRRLGEAFQLCDDWLGVFGDPQLTGKPAGEDLRDGKPTALLAYAWSHCTRAEAKLLDRVGDATLSEADVSALREVVNRSGARRFVERRIDSLREAALGALAGTPLAPSGVAFLQSLADEVTWRAR